MFYGSRRKNIEFNASKIPSYNAFYALLWGGNNKPLCPRPVRNFTVSEISYINPILEVEYY